MKVVRKLKSPMGEIGAESTAADYRKDGHILAPHKMTRKAGQEFLMLVDTVQYNAPIPKEKLDVPDEITALLAKTR